MSIEPTPVVEFFHAVLDLSVSLAERQNTSLQLFIGQELPRVVMMEGSFVRQVRGMATPWPRTGATLDAK